MEVDGRRIISPEAERDWRLERERDGLEADRQVSSPAAEPPNPEI